MEILDCVAEGGVRISVSLLFRMLAALRSLDDPTRVWVFTELLTLLHEIVQHSQPRSGCAPRLRRRRALRRTQPFDFLQARSQEQRGSWPLSAQFCMPSTFAYFPTGLKESKVCAASAMATLPPLLIQVLGHLCTSPHILRITDIVERLSSLRKRIPKSKVVAVAVSSLAGERREA